MRLLVGENCHLRALEPEDIDFLYEFENDEMLWNAGENQIPFSKKVLKEYIAKAHISIYEMKQFRFVIENTENQIVGCIDLYDFNPKNRRASVGIAVLEKFRGKGYGSEALQMLLDYAGSRLDLLQLYAEIAADNEISLKLFRKIGFQHTATLKSWLFQEGKTKDIFLVQYFF